MNPGDYRHRVIIKRPSDTVDNFNQSVSWEDVCTIKVAIEPLLGKNYYAAQQTQTNANKKIRCRYNDKIKRNMRVYFKDIAYDIEDVITPKTKYEELIIMCKEVVL